MSGGLVRSSMPVQGVIAGPFVQRVIRDCRAQGIEFSGSWEDLSGFVKIVNEGWSAGPKGDFGWFPPRIFDGVPRLHLPRTLTVMTMVAYFVEARGIQAEPIREGRMLCSADWWGAIEWEGEAVAIREERAEPIPVMEIMHVHTPPPVSPGVQKALMEVYGLQPLLPEVGISTLHAFARRAGDIQGFSMSLLVRDGRLLPVILSERPPDHVAQSYFQEPLNPLRIQGHLARYYEMFDMPETLARAWTRASVSLLGRLLCDGTVWGRLER